MTDSQPIGIFDSGMGGLTVLAELIHHLPNEKFIYVGDTARVPYGSKSKETVQRYSYEIASFLDSLNIKMLVIACNTASAYAYELLKENFSMPIVNVIHPGVNAFFNKSYQDSVAVIGTRGTIKSDIYRKLILERDQNVIVFSKACPLFVPLVEEGYIEGYIVEKIIYEYLQEIVDKKIQNLILGCTHYPLLKNTIKKVYPQLNLIDSSYEIALYIKEQLKELNLLNEKNLDSNPITIYLTDITDRVSFLEKLFLEKDGFLIIKNNYIELKENQNIKFPIILSELSVEKLENHFTLKT